MDVLLWPMKAAISTVANVMSAQLDSYTFSAP